MARKTTIDRTLVLGTILVIIILSIVVFKSGNNKDYFTDMPSPGVSPLPSSDLTLTDCHIKTAHDPLSGPSGLFTQISSLGNGKVSLDIENMKYVLNRGVRALSFGVVYKNNIPTIVSGFTDYDKNVFKHTSSNSLPFDDVMYAVNELGTKHSSLVQVPNYTDPLLLVLRIYNPQQENELGHIQTDLKKIFGNKITSSDGSYLKYSPGLPLDTLKSKVLIIVYNEGQHELSMPFKDMIFSNISIYNNETISNSLITSSSQLTMIVPSDDGKQNKHDCNTHVMQYFNNGIQMIAMNYKLEGDDVTSCLFKYEQRFKDHKSAFIPRNDDMYEVAGKKLMR
tara:strand:+ start:559 stop:1572 length:1014 start_codon:yes stop_codon:yes gene_type:complete